jgi:hypothetical protein
MTAKLFIRANENGEIVTWGADMPDAIEIASANIPSDWGKYADGKYVWNGSALVARSGWVVPVIDDTVSIPVRTPDAEVPADPE